MTQADHRLLSVPEGLDGERVDAALARLFGLSRTRAADLIAAGQVPTTDLDPRQPMETMTAFIGATAKGDIPTGSTSYKSIFAVGFTLFVMTLLVNAIAIRFVRKYRQVYE